MNERIKQLADQAGLHDFVLTAMGIDEEVKNLAELIVRECADIVDNDDSSYPYDSFGHKLKQHFGVEV